MFKDINECRDGESCCDQSCSNTPGGYECSCRGGFTLLPDKCGCAG